MHRTDMEIKDWKKLPVNEQAAIIKEALARLYAEGQCEREMGPHGEWIYFNNPKHHKTGKK